MDQAAVDRAKTRRSWLWHEQHSVINRAELSAIYHRKRERFLSHSQKLCEATAALTATTAFSTLVEPNGPGKYFALAAAIASIIPLVFGLSDRARSHGELASAHRQLLAQIQSMAVRLTEDQVLQVKGALGALEAKEIASLGGLIIECQNEMAVARGHPEKVVPMTFWQKLLMHFVDMQIGEVTSKNDPEAKA